MSDQRLVDTLSAVATKPGSAFASQFELLKIELTLVDSAIRSHDEITKNIKQWAIIAWTGGVGLALGESALTSSVWVTAFVPLTFWIVDGSYRRVQRSFIVRTQEIAAFINSAKFLAAAEAGAAFDFELMKMRSKQGRRTSWFSVMKFRTVALLYVLMITGSVLLAVVVAQGDL
jgi:hypothetical protein